jgi:hypothetical protein
VDLSADHAWITLPAIGWITLVKIAWITPAEYQWISLRRSVTVSRPWLSKVENGQIENPCSARLGRDASARRRLPLPRSEDRQGDQPDKDTILERRCTFPVSMLDRLDRIGGLLTEDVPNQEPGEDA